MKSGVIGSIQQRIRIQDRIGGIRRFSVKLGGCLATRPATVPAASCAYPHPCAFHRDCKLDSPDCAFSAGTAGDRSNASSSISTSHVSGKPSESPKENDSPRLSPREPLRVNRWEMVRSLRLHSEISAIFINIYSDSLPRAKRTRNA